MSSSTWTNATGTGTGADAGTDAGTGADAGTAGPAPPTTPPPTDIVLLIKPHANEYCSTITQELYDSPDVSLLSVKTMHWTSREAAAFYKEHEGKSFFPRLVSSMCGTVVRCVVRVRDLDLFRLDVCGPTDPLDAKADVQYQNTFRARFGTVLPFNAVHSSDSVAAARRELALLD
jgi:nucleoside-diphosphate kinase